ncbi:hypothetical protein ScPMuIL_002668 [Solemya velum]
MYHPRSESTENEQVVRIRITHRLRAMFKTRMNGLGSVWFGVFVISSLASPILGRDVTHDCEFDFLSGERRGEVELVCEHAGLTYSKLPINDDQLNISAIDDEHILGQITSLDFKNNLIEAIPQFAFSFLSRVVEISFQHNHLTVIPEKAFSEFKNLQMLNLSLNRITNGSAILSTVPPSVTTLDLSRNPIKTLLARERVLSLEKLYLSNCKIDNIDEDAFAGLSSLKYLDLSYNHITSFDGEFLSLNYLDLSANWLTVPPPPIQSLETLILSKNRISSIPEHIFSNMVDFKNLYIANNNLQSIANTSLPLHRLEVLRLEGNPWDCCTLRWMTSDKVKTLAREKHFILRCKEPSEHEHHDVFSLQKNELSCESRYTLLTAMITSMLAALLVATVGIVLYRKRQRLLRLAKWTTRDRNNSSGGKYVAVYSQNDTSDKVMISDQDPLVSMANNTSTMIDV